MKDLKDILSHFSLAGKILEIKPLGAGLDLQRCGYAAK